MVSGVEEDYEQIFESTMIKTIVPKLEDWLAVHENEKQCGRLSQNLLRFEPPETADQC